MNRKLLLIVTVGVALALLLLFEYPVYQPHDFSGQLITDRQMCATGGCSWAWEGVISENFTPGASVQFNWQCPECDNGAEFSILYPANPTGSPDPPMCLDVHNTSASCSFDLDISANDTVPGLVLLLLQSSIQDTVVNFTGVQVYPSTVF